MKKEYIRPVIPKNIIFGPIFSRRFGKSLGIDLSPQNKQCNFDCLYCELEGKRAMESMQEVIAVNTIIEALFSRISADLDVLTITANGEPTLYPHLYELITKLKSLIPPQIKTLILSNGSTFGDAKVQKALKLFDIVKFSFDAGNEKEFLRIDRPHKQINLDAIKAGILDFSMQFQGELIAEVLFVKGINDGKSNILALCDFFSSLPNLNRIDLNTIDRPPAYAKEPISYNELESISIFFKSKLNIPINIPKRKPAQSLHQNLDSTELYELIKRRPIELFEAREIFNEDTLKRLDLLTKNHKIFLQKTNNLFFYTTREVNS